MSNQTRLNVLAIALCLAGLAVALINSSVPTAHAQPLADVTAFSQDWELYTPHNTNELVRQPRGVMVFADGSFSALGHTDDGTTCVTMSLTANVIYPLSPRKICDTGTDATSVLLIY